VALALFTAPSAWAQAPAGRVYVPIAPCRIVDTRIPPNPLLANTPRTFHVVGSTSNFVGQGGKAGGCGIPGFLGPSQPQVQAVMFNFVAVDVLGAGDLRAWATDHTIPFASILNYAAVPGLNLANGIAVPVRQDLEGNDISVQADATGVDLVVDVVGYFTDFALGQVVKSLSGQTDNVTVSGSNGLSVSAGSGTITVTSNATPSNVASAIVSRDGSGNFSAGTITGNLNGTATSAANFSGSLAGEVTGAQGATVVSNAVPSNTPSTVVRRDGSGNFSAGTVTLAGNLALPNTGAAGSVGILTMGGALFLHNFGTGNTFLGAYAGNTATTGNGGNTGVGNFALGLNTTGQSNSAFGTFALFSNTTNGANAAFGNWALYANKADGNAAFGTSALYANTTGNSNSALGWGALFTNTTGSYNAAFGTFTGYYNTTGQYNSAFGYGGLGSNTTGSYNSAFGEGGLYSLKSGTFNTAIGAYAGGNVTGGNDNIYISNSGPAGAESNTIRIGTPGTQTATFVAGISGATSGSGVAVLVNPSGQLGTTTSSRRFKDEIANMGKESDVLLKLRPVAFYYKPEYDETRTRQYGLVAEEVAEVAPQLVVTDKEGAPETVRYHFVNAMLLNEVQKLRRLADEQGKENEEQRTTITRQESKIQELAARLARVEAALAGGH
jgi:hypothetical protein